MRETYRKTCFLLFYATHPKSPWHYLYRCVIGRPQPLPENSKCLDCLTSSVFCFCILQLSEILWESFEIPLEVARQICNAYLRTFRKCPDNPAMDLDTWRHLLWTQALGETYSTLAGDVYLKWLQLRYHYLAPSPEVMAMVDKLHQQYMLGLITNGPSRAQWEKIHRLNLKNHFDVILVSGELPWEKPQHEIFHEACQFLGVEPHQCLMIGDKLETDILGGIQAKLGATVWLPLNATDGHTGDIHPDYVIDKVTDLPKLLPKRKAFRSAKFKQFHHRNLPDLDDCNSNSSDGS